MEYCHYYTEKGEKFFIPMCWGSVIHGKESCTCEHEQQKKSEFQALSDRVDKLEKKISELEALLK